jgi:hypothetical protein
VPVAAVVYLDAFIPANGQSLHDLVPMGGASPGDVILPPPAALFGLLGADADWMDSRTRPQPRSTFTQPARYGRPYTGPTTYVRATGWASAPHFAAAADQISGQPGGAAVELEGSHDLMIDKAADVCELLLTIAAGLTPPN